MLLPNDFLHRLKALRTKRATGFGSQNNKMLLEWTVVLSFGMLLILLVFIYAMYRFSYWNNIENNLSDGTNPVSSYGQDKVETILKEFDKKAMETEEIIGEPVVSEPEPPVIDLPSGSPVSAQ